MIYVNIIRSDGTTQRTALYRVFDRRNFLLSEATKQQWKRWIMPHTDGQRWEIWRSGALGSGRTTIHNTLQEAIHSAKND